MNTKQLALLTILFLVSDLSWGQSSVEDPDPGRFAQEIEQFSQWDAKNSFSEGAILFVGSSSIRFWKSHDAFPQYPIINRGFGGAHISDVQHYYQKVIGKYNPAMIVFYAGDNDVAADKPVSQVVGDYKEITDRILEDFPNVKFVYVPIKPSSSRWSYWPTMKTANRLIKAYNIENDQLYYIDLATPLLNGQGNPRDELFVDDLLHLNSKGYAVWNRIMSSKLQSWYQK